MAGIGTLDSILSIRPRPKAGPMASSVSDSFMAARTMNTLDELDLDKYPQWSSGEMLHSKGHTVTSTSCSASQPLMATASKTPSVSASSQYQHSARTSVTSVTSAAAYPQYSVSPADEEKPRANGPKRADDSAEKDLVEDGESKEADMMYIGTILDDDDDSFIPFDPPLVSKYGPISRNARVKGRNTDPVQVTADENMRKCTAVLSVTPISRPYPTSAPVPSMYKPQMHPGLALNPAAAAVSASSMVTMTNSTYSFWSGQDWFVHKIPEMVHELEKSAIRATTTGERLALQLQAVELQISMRTGQNPKPVHELLKEAVQAEPKNGHIPAYNMGMSLAQERACMAQSACGEYATDWK